MHIPHPAEFVVCTSCVLGPRPLLKKSSPPLLLLPIVLLLTSFIFPLLTTTIDYLLNISSSAPLQPLISNNFYCRRVSSALSLPLVLHYNAYSAVVVQRERERG